MEPRKSHYARLTSEQRAKYIQCVIDNRKRRNTSVTLMEATSSEHDCTTIVDEIGLVSNEPQLIPEEPQGARKFS